MSRGATPVLKSVGPFGLQSSEQQVFLEATEILLKSLTPAKMARFIASWQKSNADYLDIKEELFKDETVETLYPQILEFQGKQA